MLTRLQDFRIGKKTCVLIQVYIIRLQAYPSLKPLASWVTDLVARVQFIEKWIEHGIPPVRWNVLTENKFFLHLFPFTDKFCFPHRFSGYQVSSSLKDF